MFEILEGAPFLSYQGAPRFGLSHLGISAGGAADPISWHLANQLVGNSNEPALEMTLKGGTFRFQKEGVFALTGADCGATLDDEPVAPWRTHPVKTGQILKLGVCRDGARAYLAASGRRALLETKYRLPSRSRLRALPGEAFSPHGAFEVTAQSNRNGIRLKGKLPAASGEILTEGVLWGTVQVTPSGEPLILMNDQQTTGGYPKYAQVIQADRGRLGQLRPGESFEFEWVQAPAAVEILREQVRAITVSPRMKWDINLDAGEGEDPKLYEMVSRVNVACGGHIGDDASMTSTVRLAKAAGVIVGAHPSYPDQANFGRKPMPMAPEEVSHFVAAQVGALQKICDLEKVPLHHVKPHGALYNACANDETLAAAVAEGARRVSPNLVLVGLAGTKCLDVWKKLGFSVLGEGFADRRYQADGTLVPRSQPGAVLSDPKEALAQARALKCGTLCIHGDNPAAALLLEALRHA